MWSTALSPHLFPYYPYTSLLLSCSDLLDWKRSLTSKKVVDSKTTTIWNISFQCTNGMRPVSSQWKKRSGFYPLSSIRQVFVLFCFVLFCFCNLGDEPQKLSNFFGPSRHLRRILKVKIKKKKKWISSFNQSIKKKYILLRHHSKLISAPDNPKPNKHKWKKMLKTFNFIVIRPPKLHIIMYSSFPTFLDCGSDIMWRHYDIIVAEFLTEPTGEPTGNRKVKRIHSVNFFLVSEPQM